MFPRFLTICIDSHTALDLIHCFAFVRENFDPFGEGEYLGVARAILMTFPSLREEFGWLDCRDEFENNEQEGRVDA